MPLRLSWPQLTTANILIDRFSPDAFGSARYLAEHGARHVRIVDAEPVPDELQAQAVALSALGVSLAPCTDPQTLPADDDLIFADLFQSPLRPFILSARERGVPVTNHADLILQLSLRPTIGVTGSAGKSSATLLVYEALRAAGQPAKCAHSRHWPAVRAGSPRRALFAARSGAPVCEQRRRAGATVACGGWPLVMCAV